MRRNMELALRLAADGRIPLDLFTTHRVPYADAQELYTRIGARERGMLGCVIQWQGAAKDARMVEEYQEPIAV